MIERTVSVGRTERSYLLYIPEKARGVSAVPVVVMFHGGLGKPENMPAITEFNPLADREGFAVVYPRGTSRVENVDMYTWNGGLCCGYAQETDVDDAGFVRVLLDDLSKAISVDPRRVFAAGFSNGAILTYRLACQLADRIAAIGPVSGTQNISECRPSRSVSVIHFHGTEDPMVPFAGGHGDGLSGTSFTSVAASVNFWVTADGCPATPSHHQNDSLIHDAYAPCADGTAVELYAIVRGAHRWPGGDGNTIDASSVMWEFFKAHPMPETVEPADSQG
jgi:polyhydroxybutyrate depolymerase